MQALIHGDKAIIAAHEKRLPLPSRSGKSWLRPARPTQGNHYAEYR
ncbi:hypothetical protein [Klebsiella pneumoniae]